MTMCNNKALDPIYTISVDCYGNVLKPGYTMLYINCTIYSNTFRFTMNRILQGMTVSNIQLLIGVYDSLEKFENFERNIKYIK